jgi:hypothetical protein
MNYRPQLVPMTFSTQMDAEWSAVLALPKNVLGPFLFQPIGPCSLDLHVATIQAQRGGVAFVKCSNVEQTWQSVIANVIVITSFLNLSTAGVQLGPKPGLTLLANPM